MNLKTEFFDGLEFVLPTWDPTPTPWNIRGSWFRDSEVEGRVLAGIRAAVPHHEELAREAMSWTYDAELSSCKTFWGSHGCDRPPGHNGLCMCGTPQDGLCSAGLKYGDSDTFILW